MSDELNKELPTLWKHLPLAGVYTELAHPADLFLEIWGSTFEELCEHALFALFDTLVDLETVEARESYTLAVEAPQPEDRLRRLLSEALILFYTKRFLAAGARVTTDGSLSLTAILWGEKLDRSRHQLLAEVKAVTRHQLKAEQMPDGSWRATVLFDM